MTLPRRCWPALLLPLLLLAGCGGSGPQGKGSGAKLRIAVIPKGLTHDFWKSIRAGAIAAAREKGNVEIDWDGPAKEDERGQQQQIVERKVAEGVDAIILAPCDKQTLVAPVEAALQRGVPVVVIDSGLAWTPAVRQSPKYLGYVATDNRQGGVAAAQRMLDLLKDKPKAKVMLLRYQKGSESTEQREAGFRDTVKGQAGSVTLVEPPDEAGATVDSAQQAAERLLTVNHDLDGIFAPNESSATGVLQALRVLKRNGKMKFVGFDSSPVLLEGLRGGDLDGLVMQDPFDMGYQAVRRVLGALPLGDGKVYHTNLAVVTRANLEEPAIKNLYARDLKAFE